jgi:hypothetical protein
MIRKKQSTREIVIDLTGPEGNVFVLMGTAHRLAKQLAPMFEEELKENQEFVKLMNELGLEEGPVPGNLGDLICNQMMSGDYENAIQVFDRYLGSFVILER